MIDYDITHSDGEEHEYDDQDREYPLAWVVVPEKAWLRALNDCQFDREQALIKIELAVDGNFRANALEFSREWMSPIVRIEDQSVADQYGITNWEEDSGDMLFARIYKQKKAN